MTTQNQQASTKHKTAADHEDRDWELRAEQYAKLTAERILEGIGKTTQRQNEFLVARNDIIDACAKLRTAGFEHLSCITAIDWKTCWEIVYHIARIGEKELVVLRVTLPRDSPQIPSITAVWPGAGWHERESYDLMGIIFTGNKDLRRILLPDDFDGHPLRKEVRYGNTS